MNKTRETTYRILFIAALGVSMVATQGFSKPFFINISESLPRGIYFKHRLSENDFAPGSLVALPVPPVVGYLTARDWLSNDIPILKPIAAIEGDHVCITSGHLLINSKYVGDVANHDSKGLPLPQIVFCRNLQKDEIWLSSTRIPNSFDSRYFGPVLTSDITYLVQPIFTE